MAAKALMDRTARQARNRRPAWPTSWLPARLAAFFSCDTQTPHVFRWCPQVSVSLAPGSTVTCLNVKAPEDFDAMLVDADVGFRRSHDGQGAWWTVNEGAARGVVVRHWQADPIKYHEVAPLLHRQSFDTAIVLGSVVGETLLLNAGLR